jgi:hypothetical protein
MESMKKGLSLVLLLTLVGSLLSCKKSEEPIAQLVGVWIEQTDRLDTLIFEKIDGRPFLSLHRGTETRDGHQLPKSGSGMYDYQIQKDSISLLSLYSSCSNCNENYYFVTVGRQIRIGDFYKKNSPNPQTLTFIKKD